ncbi:unnamed protein product, partial [Urochloa humidicola]
SYVKSLKEEISVVQDAGNEFSLSAESAVRSHRYDLLAIPFQRYCGGIDRTVQAKSRHSNGQGCWPVKQARFILS